MVSPGTSGFRVPTPPRAGEKYRRIGLYGRFGWTVPLMNASGLSPGRSLMPDDMFKNGHDL